jgi:hypothetical protein
MKITIIENEKPNLGVCEMVCDKKLADHLDTWEITKFLNNHSVNLLVGRPASGKSSLLYSFFNSKGENRILRKVYHNIYLFMPNASQSSFKKNIFDTLDENKKFNELDYDNLEEVMDRIKQAEPYENNCIIFDDMGRSCGIKILKSYLKNLFIIGDIYTYPFIF